MGCATATLAQLWPPGRAGGPGVSAQRLVGGEGRIDIGRALAAQLVKEKGVRQSGATPTHAQKTLFVDSREQTGTRNRNSKEGHPILVATSCNFHFLFQAVSCPSVSCQKSVMSLGRGHL